MTALVCAVCGVTMAAGRFGPTKKVCSDRCRQTWKYRRDAIRSGVTCAGCGAPMAAVARTRQCRACRERAAALRTVCACGAPKAGWAVRCEACAGRLAEARRVARQRRCMDCGTPVSKQSTGRCRACYMAAGGPPTPAPTVGRTPRKLRGEQSEKPPVVRANSPILFPDSRPWGTYPCPTAGCGERMLVPGGRCYRCSTHRPRALCPRPELLKVAA